MADEHTYGHDSPPTLADAEQPVEAIQENPPAEAAEEAPDAAQAPSEEEALAVLGQGAHKP